MTPELTETTARLLKSLEEDEIHAQRGYLVGLDRPALLAPDAGALLAASRPLEVLVTGHRWRVVTESLWLDLLALGRERPEQQVLVFSISDLEAWLNDPTELADLDADGWRGNQGNVLVVPITW